MDIYDVWCDLKPGIADLAFSKAVAGYMGHLKDQGLIEGWRLMRRKLGLGAPGLGEFHPMIEVRDLAQLEMAFQRVAGRREPVEGIHFGVSALVQNAVFALYRDFPDPVRHQGEGLFQAVRGLPISVRAPAGAVRPPLHSRSHMTSNSADSASNPPHASVWAAPRAGRWRTACCKSSISDQA